VTLPFRLHAWFGSFQLDSGRHVGPPSRQNEGRLALLFQEVVADALGRRWLAEQLRELNAREPREMAELAIAAVQDGRIAIHELARTSTTLSFVPPVVDLKDLEEPVESPASNEAQRPTVTTSFEVQIVDELGEPVPDVELLLQEDGGTRGITTDGSGVARVDDATGDFGAVRFASVPALRVPLHERWRTIRPGDWLEPETERTVLQLREEMPSVSLRADTPHVISIQPRVVLARLLGMLFDSDKTFLLPSALSTIRAVKQLYDENPGASVLAVGHTDTTGAPEHNLVLSSDRADALVAYLSDDVAAWLDWYGSHHLASQRWGATEDLHMISAMPDAATRDPSEDPVSWYQRTRGLEVDGVAGPSTRESLVGEYMATDGTSLPAGTPTEAHGCGENFPTTPAGDEADVAENRRVELFLFESEIMPAPAGPHSTADAPEYPEWHRRARETHDFRPGEYVLAPLVVAWSRAIVDFLPAETVLSLTGEGIPAQDLVLADGEASDGVVSFAFDNASASQPCTLTARAGEREIVLWRDEVIDRIEPPLQWLADLADLIEPNEDVDEPADEATAGDLDADDMLVGDPPWLNQAVA
jgi:outer membrane protein OmpA-like peptidoglycan-associated protein